MIFRGAIPLESSGTDSYFRTILETAHRHQAVSVLVQASCYHDVVAAYELRGQGVGLYRTEDMFSHGASLEIMRRYLLCVEHTDRVKHLSELMVLHKAEFCDVFRAAHGTSLTMCLLTKPLRDFFPARNDPDFGPTMLWLSDALRLELSETTERVEALDDTQQLVTAPDRKAMLLHPELITMQTMAFVGAAIDTRIEGVVCAPRIAIPGVTTSAEVNNLSAAIEAGIIAASEKTDHLASYTETQLCAVINSPRGCFNAESIATNLYSVILDVDRLSELVFGMSMADRQALLSGYQANRKLNGKDPFATLDTEVVHLVQLAVAKIREVNKCVKIQVVGGVCGDPRSVSMLHSLGVDSVICAPHKVPPAVIAAAQANIRHSQQQSK
jgi:pyruvate,orthophosphate dikinase